MTSNGDLKSPSDGVIEPPPISKLPEDLLWRIFLINTDNMNLSPYHPQAAIRDPGNQQYGPRPLNTTRISSQVCSTWRTILLASPSIWGRLIDFVSFNTKGNYWRKEVISRSGRSLLWVVGGSASIFHARNTIGYSKKLTRRQSFFLEFITEHWERIEKLWITGWLGKDFSVFCRPAPNLKAFKFNPSQHRLYIPDSETIFGGHAPRLHSFEVVHPKKLCLSIDWMASIRDLSLSLFFGDQFNRQCVSEVLQLMPLLEALELNIGGMLVDSAYHPPSICLPRLHTLKLSGCLEFARNIQPGPGCFFRIREYRTHIISNIVNEDALTRLYRNYTDAHPPQFISLTQTGHEIILRSSQSIQANTGSEIELKHKTQALGALVYCLEAFILPQFSEVSCMHLQLHEQSSSNLQENYQPKILSAFKKFALSFASLDNISADGNTLSILLHEELASSLVFPRLRVLAFNTENFGVEYLMRFIDLRRQLGVPISILDLTIGDITSVECMRGLDLEALDGHVGNGMIIRLRYHGETLCKYEWGRGHAEVLQSRIVELLE